MMAVSLGCVVTVRGQAGDGLVQDILAAGLWVLPQANGDWYHFGDPPAELIVGSLARRDGRRAVMFVNHSYPHTA